MYIYKLIISEANLFTALLDIKSNFGMFTKSQQNKK